MAATLVGGHVSLIWGHLQGQEFTLVGDILCSDNATDIENIELLFGAFHICDRNLKEVTKICS
jgi:hypothetical protein